MAGLLDTIYSAGRTGAGLIDSALGKIGNVQDMGLLAESLQRAARPKRLYEGTGTLARLSEARGTYREGLLRNRSMELENEYLQNRRDFEANRLQNQKEEQMRRAFALWQYAPETAQLLTAQGLLPALDPALMQQMNPQGGGATDNRGVSLLLGENPGDFQQRQREMRKQQILSRIDPNDLRSYDTASLELRQIGDPATAAQIEKLKQNRSSAQSDAQVLELMENLDVSDIESLTTTAQELLKFGRYEEANKLLERAQSVRELKESEQEAAEEKQTKVEAASDKQQDLETQLEDIDYLLNEGAEGLESITGHRAGTTFGTDVISLFSQDAASADQRLTRLENFLTTENLKLFTGVLTDNDIRFLQSISKVVFRRDRPENVVKGLQKARGIISKGLQKLQKQNDQAGGDLSLDKEFNLEPVDD
tara:strand:- start:385 stop:1650 length:1266 start_codon:yes stop_codon:yes gene_type:complete